MKQYSIVSTGYEPSIPISDLTEARLALYAEIDAAYKKARQISKTARKHKLGIDNYSITLGSDPRSHLYATFALIEI